MNRLQEGNSRQQDFAWEIDSQMQLNWDAEGGLLPEGDAGKAFAGGYFGIHPLENGWIYREWAPGANRLYFTGEFNGWNRGADPMFSLGNGCWVLYLPGEDTLWEGCKVRTVVEADVSCGGDIPLYARRMHRDSGFTRK